ncbi:serine/threonine-protein kinase [Aristaeella lactis]|uniref:Protein kinase domain-containing protein n=1 Tax=Aristaeella lactis TaxID=3046383 RepID=A0AC61PLJ2_9FIRM|nr:serine/threonine-protein kinase [Aristaeella lactis]QUA54663.1 serine/threonine protein kinase [Aristaeella lactis]SMC63697.1 Protein kinase domain-containing protein [Aristaeella lactis]
MDNRTVINQQLEMPIATTINPDVQQMTMPIVTTINPDTVEESRNTESNKDSWLQSGSKLQGSETYTVRQKMKTTSGEADLYLCKTESNRIVVAKVYKRENPLKTGVVEALKSIRSPYVARVYDVFLWNNHTVVILQFYKNGSLNGKTYSLEQLKAMIIPNINEGLKAIHSVNLLHKDLKPANIMLCDDGLSVAIIDFGISSLLEEGATVLLTQTGMTPVYSAPELFKGLALAEADYYSFGITLYELFCGKTPYSDLSDAEIAMFSSIQRIPLPKEMPGELQKLIAALTYPDITNRHDKSNPNRRWMYDEVRKWLTGESIISPGGFDTTEINPLAFEGKTYHTVRDLIEAMGLNWNAGKRLLFHGSLANHIRATNAAAYESCCDAVRKASETNAKDDLVFFEFLYDMVPEMEAIYWKGRRFASPSALGREMLEALWKENESQYKLYDTILSERVLSTYVLSKDSNNNDLLQVIKRIENLWKISKDEKRDLRYVYYLSAYLLSNQKILKIDNEEIRTVDELSDYLNRKLQVSIKTFIEATHQFVDYDGNLDVQLEAWLTAIGKKDAINQWKEVLRSGAE